MVQILILRGLVCGRKAVPKKRARPRFCVAKRDHFLGLNHIKHGTNFCVACLFCFFVKSISQAGSKLAGIHASEANCTSVGPKQMYKSPMLQRDNGSWRKSKKNIFRVKRENKWETNVKSCGPERSEWQPSVGDKWGTHEKSRGPEHPERETSGRHAGDKWETSGGHAAQSTQSGRQVGDKSKIM